MKTYIQKQPKLNQEHVDVKLDADVIKTLERYCQFLDSDRHYVVSQALEIAFRKDKGFTAWLTSHSE